MFCALKNTGKNILRLIYQSTILLPQIILQFVKSCFFYLSARLIFRKRICGRECETKSFPYVITNSVKLVKNEGCGPPGCAIKTGYQTHGAGCLYAAIANTEYGTIPGKAIVNTCCYPYGGKEDDTGDFLFKQHSNSKVNKSSV